MRQKICKYIYIIFPISSTFSLWQSIKFYPKTGKQYINTLAYAYVCVLYISVTLSFWKQSQCWPSFGSVSPLMKLGPKTRMPMTITTATSLISLLSFSLSLPSPQIVQSTLCFSLYMYILIKYSFSFLNTFFCFTNCYKSKAGRHDLIEESKVTEKTSLHIYVCIGLYIYIYIYNCANRSCLSLVY